MQSILIIEDEAELRDGISDILRFEGYVIIEATDGEDGIFKAREFLPDLVLCDILMPKKSGFEVIEELRKDPQTALIPFIFLTAMSQKDKIREGMNAGADDYLEKPFSREDLISTIQARFAKIERMKKSAELQLNKYKERFISHLPHELRTPLNSILGFSELLMSDAELLDKYQIGDMAKIINSNGERLFELVKKYLLFLELEFSKDQHDFHNVSLIREGIEDIAKTIAKSYNRENDLEIVGADKSAKVIINLFRVVVKELVDNAFKFSDEGSKVKIALSFKDDYHCIKITDQGRGFPSNITDILPFNQYNRTKYEQQGVGLGLYLSKQIISLHSGLLEIKNSKDRGATIIFKIPTRIQCS